MNDYYRAVVEATARVNRLSEDLALMIQGMPQEPLVRALMSFYGIQLLSAVIIAAELGDLRRFKTARQLMAFLGLVPSEHSTGQTIRRGSITRTGNVHVRRILVEAVQHYRQAPSHNKELERRRRGVSAEVLVIARKAERRLYQRKMHLVARNKPWNKMIIALARELAGFVWAVGQVSSFLEPTKVGIPVKRAASKPPKKGNKERGHTTQAQQQQGLVETHSLIRDQYERTISETSATRFKGDARPAAFGTRKSNARQVDLGTSATDQVMRLDPRISV